MTVSNPIDMEAFENAIHSWFSEATGFDKKAVIWRQTSAPQPKYPFGSLMITSGPTPVAPQWEQRPSTDLTRGRGEEVEFVVCVPCSFMISCQAYVGQVDARNPNENALQYMAKAQSSLSLPSVIADLQAVQIAVIRPGPVQNINELIEDAFVSRANMDVEFGAALNVAEYTGYIEKVHGTSTSLGIDQIFGVGV